MKRSLCVCGCVWVCVGVCVCMCVCVMPHDAATGDQYNPG